MSSPEPTVRAKGIIQACKLNDLKSLPLIVDRLEDEDKGVRLIARNALHELAGRDFGFDPADSLYQRTKAVEKWRDYVLDDKTTGSKACSTGPAKIKE